MKPPKPTLAARAIYQWPKSWVELAFSARTIDQTVVGGNHDRGAARQRHHKIGNEAVAGGQLGVVVLAKTEFVSNLVDTVVVRVDKRLTATNRPPNLDG